jgi:hypothetical protein
METMSAPSYPRPAGGGVSGCWGVDLKCHGVREFLQKFFAKNFMEILLIDVPALRQLTGLDERQNTQPEAVIHSTRRQAVLRVPDEQAGSRVFTDIQLLPAVPEGEVFNEAARPYDGAGPGRACFI